MLACLVLMSCLTLGLLHVSYNDWNEKYGFIRDENRIPQKQVGNPWEKIEKKDGTRWDLCLYSRTPKHIELQYIENTNYMGYRKCCTCMWDAP